jgi:exoribonuclease R
MLDGRVGESFAAVVTDLDEKGARVQLCDLPIVAKLDGNGFSRGDPVELKLTAVDIAGRRISFEPVG